MLVDSHCHLDYFTDEQRVGVIQRAVASGVGEMMTMGTTLSQSRTAMGIAAKSVPGAKIWASVGVHPHHAGEEGPVPDPSVIGKMTEDPRVIGIGESGLDYFYDRAPHEVQARNFRAHIHAAQATGLPLAIHARDADGDIAAILEEEYRAKKFLFLLHCFSSGRLLAERALAIGGYVSFSGILTFPKSETLRGIARHVPADRLLVETDAPYLAPVPMRGSKNEPANVVHTAAKLAEVRRIGLAEIAELTTANFKRLFVKSQ